MFQKAQRRMAKIKLAMTGPSGAGKTLSSLLLAKGLGDKIAVIDTENGSASLYANSKDFPYDFDIVDLRPPFTTDKYIEALKFAEAHQYDVLIIDSITHEWAGEGGLIQQKESLDQRNPKSNQYTNWSSITKKHEIFKSNILQSSINIIATMRSKQDYILEPNEQGKMTPKKIGMAPVQREGIEYEFTTVFDIGMNHESIVSKDRTGLFKDRIFKIDQGIGKEIKDWLLSANVEIKEPPKADSLNFDKAELSRIMQNYISFYKVNRDNKEEYQKLTGIHSAVMNINPSAAELDFVVKKNFEYVFNQNNS